MEPIRDATGEKRCANINGRKGDPTAKGKGECAKGEECARMWMVEDEEKK